MTNDYTVKGVKTFHGHDGYGWECSLYNPEGKRVAIVVEDGWGGELQFHWMDGPPKVERVEYPMRNRYTDKITTAKGTPEEAKLEAHVMAQPQQDSPFADDDSKMYINAEILVGDLVNAALLLKDLKKALKKLAISDGGQVFTFKCPPDHAATRQHIAKKYPDAVVLNDLPQAEALAIFKKQAA
jgi:hypothetical protein